MAISIKSITPGGQATSSATVTCTTDETPSATAIGDLVIVFYVNDFYDATNMGTPSATGTPTMNAITNAAQDSGTNELHSKGHWYVANTGGAQTISATETGTHDEEKLIYAVVLGGADTTTPIDDSQGTFNTASVGTHAAPSVSPATSDAFLVVLCANKLNRTYTTPAPLTEQDETAIGGALDAVIATQQLSASGATGTFGFTPSSASGFLAVTVAVKTASGGSQNANVVLSPAQADVLISG